MISSNYANMTTAYEAQKWWIPIYLNIIFYEAIVGVFFFVFAFFIIVFKTPRLNPFFRWGLVESLIIPTIFSLFVGFVFKPYVIAPYEVYWSYGYFRTPFAVWCQMLTGGTLGCFFVFSLLFIMYIYIQAFVGQGILTIGKSIKGFCIVAGICLPAFGFMCMYLEYSNLEEKQEKDRATVIAGDPNNAMFFTDLGAYILNMEGAGTLTHIQYGGIFFFAAAAIVIGLFIFLKIVYILEKRSDDISSATKKLQKTFILIVLVQIYVFIVFYGIPASSLFFLMSFKMFFLARYPIMTVMVIQVMLLPIVYSIMNLTIISQVRRAFLKFLRCGRILRIETSVTAADYANMTTAYEAQKWWIPIYLNIIFYEAIVGVFFFAFAFFIIVFKTPRLNPFFRWGLVESLVFPTLLSLFFGLMFKPYAIAPYELYWSYGYFRTPFAVWCQGLTVGTLGCFFNFSLLFLIYVYIKAFVGRGILTIGKSIKGFFIVAGICLPAFGVICMYLEYSNLEEKLEKDRATVIAGDPRNVMFFKDLGAYIFNVEGAGTLTHIQYVGIFLLAVGAIVIGLFIFFKIVYILEKRSDDISSATKKLQKTFILIVLVQIYVFIVFYGIPASSIFILMSFKMFFLAPYPIMTVMVMHAALLPIVYSIMNLTIISQVRHACLKFLRCGRILRIETSVTAAARTQAPTRNTRSTRFTRGTRQADTIAQ